MENQKISDLTAEDELLLQKQRAVIEEYLSNEEARRKYETPAGKLGAIRTILRAGVFKRDQTYNLQCLGIVLGDVFVQKMKMEWIMVEDENGRDPAIRMPGTSIILFPLTMISKRIERGEEVDVFDLFNRLANWVEEKQRDGV